MSPLRERLQVRPDELSGRAFALWLVAIYALGVVLRLGWLFRIGWDLPELGWHGVPLLSSGDGYWFASGVGQALTGEWGDNPHLPGALDHFLVALGWLSVKLSPWSLEQVVLYLPAFLGALCVVPMAVIGRTLVPGPAPDRPRSGLTRLGLAAAAVMATAPAFFSRTAAGYFDTDALAVLVPLLAIVHLLRLLRFGRPRDALWAALWLAVYPWFYNQGAPLGLALAVVAAAAILGCHRRAPWATHVLVLLALSQLPLPWFGRVALVVAAHLGLPWLASSRPGWRAPPRLVAVALVVAAAAAVAAMGPVIVNKIVYFLGDAASADTPRGGVLFGDVTAHIAEAQRLGMAEMAERLVGSIPAFIAASVGVVMMAVCHPRLWLLLPLAGLGAFSAIGGMRFGIYAVPVLALGLAYAVVWGADRVRARGLAAAALVALSALAVAPAVAWDWVRLGSPSIVNAEVAALDALRKRAEPGATTIAWWDDGYPVTYFSRTRALIDGGRHNDDAGLVAEILMNPSQRIAANLARRAIATRDQIPSDWAVAPTLFQQGLAEAGPGLDDFLAHLGANTSTMSAASTPLYLYLPLRLLPNLRGIQALRPRQPGSARAAGVYRFHSNITVDGLMIRLRAGATVDADKLVVRDAAGSRRLRTLYSLRGAGPSLQLRQRSGQADAPTSGIYLHDPAVFIELGDHYLSSTVLQLLVFGRADGQMLEQVFANDAARVYRVLP